MGNTIAFAQVLDLNRKSKLGNVDTKERDYHIIVNKERDYTTSNKDQNQVNVSRKEEIKKAHE